MEDELTRLVKKVDDHDRSLTLVSKVVEDINKNLERFADESERLRKEMAAHWSAQDKILSKMENVLEKIASYEVRFQKIEERQISGCPNFLNFKDKREGELKNWEMRASSLESASKYSRREIEDLSSKNAVVTEKLTVANNKIKGLENDRNKGMWLIITAFVGILVSLIQGFRG